MTELPTGRVTFLFTDIEGSTALVQKLGPEYGRSLGSHRDVLRDAVESRGGIVLDALGDETSNVFVEAVAALEAAVEAQSALCSQGFRVRMGVHTGEPSLSGRSYFGLDVHRAARITEVGHGCQILVSSATCEQAPDAPYEFRTLGALHLRGLAAPEEVFQVVADGLQTDFPPLRRVEAPLAPGTESGDTAADPSMRVVLAEDSVLLREGIARLLEDAGFEVVGQAGDADDLMLKVRSYSPDVAIVDIRMPPTQTDEGLQAAREIRDQVPGHGRARPLAVPGDGVRARVARPTAPRASATCSRTESRTSTPSSPPSAASETEARRSTRQSCRSSSDGSAATTRSPS